MIAHPVGRWLPAASIMAVIAWLSHQPQWPAPVRGYPDWILHILAYAVLGAACYLGARDLGRGLLAPALAAVLIATVYGVFDEIHQSFIPGRDAAVADVLADSVGAALSAVLVTFARLWGVWEDPLDVRRRPSP